MSDLYRHIGKNGRFDGEHCILGYVPKNDTKSEIFWGEPDPENVEKYIIVTVGSPASARRVYLTPKNIGRLEMPYENDTNQI